VAFRSATEPIDTSTPTGRMLIQLLGVFAEFERATIIDRVVAGMERKAARGGWPGGTVPYGLRLDDDHHLAIEPSEFPIVERIFTRYGIERAGATTIAAELNNDGHRTRTGRRWSAKVVLGIVRNRGYLGEVSFRDVVHESDEPLLDPVLFQKAQALLAERGEGYDRRFADAHPEYLLTGLITCSRCHRRYVGAAAHGKRHRYRYYVCYRSQQKIEGYCTSRSVSAPLVEDAVVESIRRVGVHPDVLAETAVAARQRLAEIVTGLRGELNTTNGRVKNLKSQVARLRNPEAQRLAEIREQLAAGEARAEELRKEILRREKQRIDEKELRRAMDSFEDVWKTMSLEEQRNLLRQLVEKVGYDGRTGKVTVSFKSAEVKELVQKEAVR